MEECGGVAAVYEKVSQGEEGGVGENAECRIEGGGRVAEASEGEGSKSGS